jgi:hypothetical protein
MTAALYHGTVWHQRFRPVAHRLRYRICWLLLDVDAMPPGLRLLSRNRFNLAGFYDRDHLDGTGAPLRPQIEAAMAAAGLAPDGGPIEVLCMPRVLGHAFNPISVFFCRRRDGALAALLYEVHNTFGERHSYLIPVDDPGARTVRQSCDKAFYVSPFMDMDMRYAFRVVPPGESAAVVVEGSDAAGPLISASFAGRRRPLTDTALLGMVLRHGMLSVKVLAAIHWEAARLWVKGLRLRPRPAPPAHAFSFAPPADSETVPLHQG